MRLHFGHSLGPPGVGLLRHASAATADGRIRRDVFAVAGLAIAAGVVASLVARPLAANPLLAAAAAVLGVAILGALWLAGRSTRHCPG